MKTLNDMERSIERACSPQNVLEELERSFELSKEGVERIVRAFHEEMDKGLQGKKSSLKMLPTYVDTPTGREKGSFLALDLGGTNCRVLRVTLKGDGRAPMVTSKGFKLTKRHIVQDGDALFGAIVKFVEDFVGPMRPEARFPLGFTFSFPIAQTAIDKGTLIHWTKGFSATGVEKQDVVKLLNEAFNRRKISQIQVVSLDNDTTGTQMARAYQDTHCHVGVILGTGTNLCVRVPTAWIQKGNVARVYKGDHMIVNMESGNFNKALPTTEYDERLDAQSNNPGAQLEEKMVSGMYLGELTRIVLLDLVQKGELLQGRYEKVFEKQGVIDAAVMGAMDGDRSSNRCGVRSELKKLGVKDPEGADVKTVQRVCAIVGTRAARIAASLISAAVTRIDPNLSSAHTVAIDGSVFELYPGFQTRMKGVYSDLFGARVDRIQMELTHDGSGVGAAIIAAVASSHPRR